MKTIKVCLLLIACLAFNSLSAQLKPLEDFLKKYPEVKEYYIYQSTLRMLNQQQDPDFDRLIKNLKKINAYVYDEAKGVSKEEFKKMLGQLEDDEFEILLVYRAEGYLVRVFGRDRGANSKYVLAMLGESNFALVEMDGHLDLRYIKAIEDLNFMKLDELLLNTKKS